LALFAVLCSCGSRAPSQSSGAASGGAGSGLLVKTFSYVDQQGLGGRAMQVLGPAGWIFEGGIQWVLNNPSQPARANFRLRDPDSGRQWELLPAEMFFWTTDRMALAQFPPGSLYLGSEVQPPLGIKDALKKIVLPRRRGEAAGLRLISEAGAPRLAESAQAAAAGATPQGWGYRAEGGRIRIEYTLAGQPFEEEIFGVAQMIQSGPMPGLSGFTTITIWNLDYLVACRAPKGRLDGSAAVFELITRSFRVDKQWYARYQQLVQYLTQNQIRQIQNIGELSRRLSRTQEEISDMIMEGYERCQQTYDRIAENFSRATRGVDAYGVPNEDYPV